MKTGRLKELCLLVWALLATEEKEAYIYGAGTIGFVEDVAKMFNIEVDDCLAEVVDEIAEQL